MAAKKGINQIGILVRGGPAPGINTVIHKIMEEAYCNYCTWMGIYDGFKHIMKGNPVGVPFTPEIVEHIYLEGGSILCSTRANPTKSPDALRQGVPTLQNIGIDALISNGGDDTAYSASQVARYAQVTMGLICVPPSAQDNRQ
jgi:ATP-dependent phosphofructokinase / diphosphate-dependent phosphofructokinase